MNEYDNTQILNSSYGVQIVQPRSVLLWIKVNIYSRNVKLNCGWEKLTPRVRRQMCNTSPNKYKEMALAVDIHYQLQKSQ